MRFVLNESDFKNYINDGFVIKEGVKILFKESDVDNLTSGGVVNQGDVQFILSDIGYCKIYKILS